MIIGLIVGGVLVGRDLTTAAKIRKTLSELESYKTATYLFKNKFGHLPGDIGPQKATAIGLTFSRAGTKGRGDQNGIINGDDLALPPPGAYILHYESKCYWADLADMNLIAFKHSGFACDNMMGYNVNEADKYGQSPLSTIGFDAQWQVYGWNGINYFVLVQYYFSGSQWRSTLPPIIAYTIDAKIDDGKPMTGAAQASDPTNTNFLSANPTPAVPAAGVCVSNATDNPYNNVVGADIGACGLRFNASF